MASPPPTKIALLVCSTRTPRVGPAIATWIAALLEPSTPPNTTLTTLDLLSFPLPTSPSGSIIPAKIPLPLGLDSYGNREIDHWSRTVRDFDGFVFLTPQYNWSFPGGLKIAIDHLFYEWGGKPCLVVSYGGRGGGKANVALQEVWRGVRGGECVASVELALVGGMEKAQAEGVLEEVVKEGWEGEGKGGQLREGFGTLVKLAGRRA